MRRNEGRRFRQREQQRLYETEDSVPAFALRWLKIIHDARAHYATGLLLAIHRRFYLRSGASDHIYLDANLWEEAGIGRGRERTQVLINLRKLPGLVTLDRAPSYSAHWRITKGRDWYLPESADLKPEEEDETAI
jgi:hypothetical protein